MRKSLDQIEKEYWNPGPSMLEAPYLTVELKEGPGRKAIGADSVPDGPVSLNGVWRMAEGGTEQKRLNGTWEDSIPANIPCSVHTALLEAGRIPDPTVGLNDKTAREYCYKEWWFLREFERSEGMASGRHLLHFDGICYRAHIWLNGTCLGTHSGMFGMPEYDITDLLQEKNRLIVKIDNAPARPRPLSDFMDNDEGWHDGVVINCVYGWHYACLPSRGIWAPVSIRQGYAVEFGRPFVTAVDAAAGIVDICAKIEKGSGKGLVSFTVAPENFEGSAWHFDGEWEGSKEDVLHYRMSIPNPRLWWPNGHGEQNLYTLTMVVQSECGEQRFQTTFGIRTIEMGPLPGGPYEDRHNWIFIINGKRIFVKGANWCTTDVLLRFPKKRYERFLSLAKAGHIQLLRAWGGGMPESDEFYDLCDEYGIMVMQEWPTCWDSQKEQPYGELEETVLSHMPRLRSHPSLIMWCGGNESGQADGEAMDMMARYAFRLDGSRPFHRTSPWGGSLHNYSTYWDMQDIDVSVNLRSHFMGEFGMASVPNLESVRKYVPEEELALWPPDKYGSFAHHTPRFNQFDPNDMDYLTKHAAEFSELDTIERFIWATQIAQATAIRHTLEACRTCWPDAAGICYYKLTDVYPAASWSTIDYYGVPKLSYYILADAYEPLKASLIVSSTRASAGLWAPVYVLDDAEELCGQEWKAVIRAYNRDLTLLTEREYAGGGSAKQEDIPLAGRPETASGDPARDASACRVKQAGVFSLLGNQVDGRLLLLTAELCVDGREDPVHRSFYWLNYQGEPGALRKLPETTLSLTVSDDTAEAIVQNTGELPAVGVQISCPGREEEFTVSDNVFWLEPGEERRIAVTCTEHLTVSAFNAKETPQRADRERN